MDPLRNTGRPVALANVDIVRGIYERRGRGEPPWSGDALETYDPDVDWIELEELRPVGDQDVLVFFSEHARGKGAGVQTESHPAACGR